MLNVVSVEKAIEIIENEFSFIKTNKEKVSLADSIGRVLFDDIVSLCDIPSFNRSVVDGYAVVATDTYGSGESIPSQLKVVGEILMGEDATMKISTGECVRISTGGMLPRGADSVVMVENTDSTFDDFCLVFKSVSPFENVIRKGDDLKNGEVILKKGTVVTSKEIGVLASLGLTEVHVFEKIKVAVISTGDEIIPIENEPKSGEIRDINTHLLSALCEEYGCDVKTYGIVKDEFESINSAVAVASKENDIVLISGGSSAGAKDMTIKVMSGLGDVFFHGVAMKPGKPTIFGKIANKAVFGLPGHPLAAYFVTVRLVGTLISRLYNNNKEKAVSFLPVSQNISSNHGREEIIVVKIENETVVPLLSKSSAVSSLSKSDGYIIIERNSEGLKKGEIVKVYIF